jgi:hypothetical protein
MIVRHDCKKVYKLDWQFWPMKTTVLSEKILLNFKERPSSEQALSVCEDEIFRVAKQIDYPTDRKVLRKIFNVHASMMPLLERAVSDLLSKAEKERPDYYAFARDCELLYDALWGIGQANENRISERLHLLKTSTSMHWAIERSDENQLLGKSYFNRLGITDERLKNGPALVFLDSGFVGSLFRDVLYWADVEESLPQKYLKGYLVDSHSSLWGKLDVSKGLKKSEAELVKNSMKRSPYRMEFKEKNQNYNLVAFMQLMPKFTGRYVEPYMKIDGTFDILPERNSLVQKVIHSNEECARLCTTQFPVNYKVDFVNNDFVDPFASILLQKKTLEYFTDPDVWDRVYSRAKKRN